MKKLFFYCFGLLFFNPINADEINASNFLEFLSEKNYFSSNFIQTTFKDDKERKILGDIKANRRGMFKITYQEPLNEIISSNPINFFNPDKSLTQTPTSLKWEALTTGNFGGFDAWLKDPFSGELQIQTALVQTKIKIKDIGFEDRVFDKSGVLPKFLKVFRLPSNNKNYKIDLKRNIPLKNKGDNPIFIRLTQEDGTVAWTSPIYVYRS